MSTVLEYEVITVNRAAIERRREFVTAEELTPGDVILLDGRYWLVERLETDGSPARAFARPARYRLLLRHPDGHIEAGAFRRYRPDAPTIGHAFSTSKDDRPVGWEVRESRLERDADGEPYIELVAERDYSEQEEIPDHELEHALARRRLELAEGAEATLARAAESGLAVELVALEAGEAPDWAEAEEFMSALVLEEIEDDVLELCGIDTSRDPREGWLEHVLERLRADLEAFRDDIEGDHDEIEEWDFEGGRIFASVGSFEDEADPDKGHGWMVRLVDSEVLGAAGFERVRKGRLEVQ